MKNGRRHQNLSHVFAFSISILSHMVCLVGMRHLRLQPRGRALPASTGHRILLQPVPTQPVHRKVSPVPTLPPVPKSSETSTNNDVHPKAVKKTTPSIVEKNTGIKPQGDATVQASPSVPTMPNASVHPPHKLTEVIDERALYQANSRKKAGVLLELIGWAWDQTPDPHDNTNEIGKIIFQIVIDDMGEVISLKTLEKTVSPLVEKIYKEALMGLTFSKTLDNLVYTPTSTGRVTFVLREE